MALRLSGAQRRVERTIMVDTCEITRPDNRFSKGTLNPATLEVTADAASAVYTGVCFVAYTDGRTYGTMNEIGGAQGAERARTLSLPASAPELRPGDRVKMLTSKYDSTLPNKLFEIRSVVSSTPLVMRRATMVSLETSRG